MAFPAPVRRLLQCTFTTLFLITPGLSVSAVTADEIDCASLLTADEVNEICAIDVTMEKSHLETGRAVAKCHRDFNTSESPVRTLMFRIMEKSNPKTAAKLFKFQRAAATEKENFTDLDFGDAAYRHYEHHKDLAGDPFHFVHFLKGSHQGMVRVTMKDGGPICSPEQASELAKIIVNRLP